MGRTIHFVFLYLVTLLTLGSALRKCETDSQCPGIQCTCANGYCFDFAQIQTDLGQCPKCSAATSDTDCNACEDDVCEPCFTNVLLKSAESCSGNPTQQSDVSQMPSSPSSPTSPPTVAQQCKGDSDCSRSGCSCVTKSNICLDLEFFKKEAASCPKCTTAADCGSGDTCAEIGVCESCGKAKLVKSAEKCGGKEFPSESITSGSSTEPLTPSSPSLNNTTSPSGSYDSPVFSPNTEKPSKTEFRTCETDNDCVGSGCSCKDGVCLNALLSGLELKKCEKCSTNEDCGANDECVSDLNVCESCATASFLKGAEKCSGNATDSSVVQCVSTAWLQRRGLSHAVIRHAGTADVLCIPGELPCGTRGHLLRECTAGGVCRLVSYGEVCDRRRDCVESRQLVSQLKHSFDWSSYRAGNTRQCKACASLSLTSLSVHPDSIPAHHSRIIAHVADALNRLGLGFVCDTIVSVQYGTIWAEALLAMSRS